MTATHVARRIFVATVCALLFAAAAPMEGDPVAVRVSVRATGGRPLADAYVAFVAPDRPEWRPSAEVVATGGVATVRIAPGTYKVFAGARGYQDSVRSIKVESATEVAFELPRSVPLTGFVYDAAGQPIAGARVQHVRLAGAVQTSRMSDRARSYFATTWTTTTNADGLWTLPGRSDGAVP
ncbi:MAG: hypothetical protein M3Q69_21520, partial [Acidobacteriota bacterium]|nr:hypothetical protein [Acidobacteriota bacterium]